MAKKSSVIDRIDMRLFTLADERAKNCNIRRTDAYRDIDLAVRTAFPDITTNPIIFSRKKEKNEKEPYLRI